MARSGELGKGSRFVVLASVCVVIGMLYFASEVLVPLALAVLLSFLLTPAVRWLEKFRLSRTPAVLIVVLIAVGAIGVIGYVVYRQSASIVENLPNYQAQLRTKFEGLRRHGNIVTRAEQELKAAVAPGTQPASQPADRQQSSNPSQGAMHDLNASHPRTASPPTAENPLPVRVVPESPTPWEVLQNYGSKLLNPLATAGLVLVFVIFMMLEREDLRDRMIRLLGHGRLNLTTQALDEASTRISRYLGRLAIMNGLYGLFTAIGLWLIGHLFGKGNSFPSVLVWGVLVGLLRFVPYVGVWIGAAFPLILSFALFPGDAVFFATAAMFVGLEVIVSQFIEPMWYGASTGMTPLAVLVAAVFWTWLWGPIGLLLSTPLTVCLVVIGKHVPQLEFIDILLRDEPVLEPHLRIYQRLIAEDPEEAAELAQTYLDDRTLEQVFDQVLVPALSLAVHDHHRRRLDAERFAAVLAGMREIVEELADADKAARVQEQAAATVELAKTGTTPPSTKRPPVRLPKVPSDCTINILCLPARDEADEIVALMAAQLLELRGYCAFSTSSTPLAAEMLQIVEQKKADIICVSALPPAAISHSRYLCKRLHARWPNVRMIIGLWTEKRDLKRARERISCGESVPVVTSLSHAQDQIEQLAHPLVVNAASPAATLS